jgi:hypothetical protein
MIPGAPASSIRKTSRNRASKANLLLKGIRMTRGNTLLLDLTDIKVGMPVHVQLITIA